MTNQRLAQRSRSTLIEQDLHSSSFECASSRMLQDRARLIHRDAGKPLDEIAQRRVVFKILKQGRNGHSRAAKHPCAAHAFGISFYSWAGGPLDHPEMVALARIRVAEVWTQQTGRHVRYGEQELRGMFE